MGKITGVSQVCAILEVLRCTDKFCNLSGSDALHLQKIKTPAPAIGEGGNEMAPTFTVRDPSSPEELISVLADEIPAIILEWASKLLRDAATAGNVFTAPIVHVLPLLFLAPSNHANLEDLQVLYGCVKFADIDMSLSMARILSGHWPALDLFASALTPVLRDMEARLAGASCPPSRS
jgi:hypothetical protein